MDVCHDKISMTHSPDRSYSNTGIQHGIRSFKAISAIAVSLLKAFNLQYNKNEKTVVYE